MNEQTLPLRPIATVTTDFPVKFGIPRQSGLAATRGYLRFLPEFRSKEAVRGLEGYSHVWLIWGFSECPTGKWSPTVRPPRLGGNTRVGVFATRSPFRPNPIGLSSARLVEILYDEKDGPILVLEGLDLMSGTPVYDVKPYLPYTDSHPDAVGGFADGVRDYKIEVDIPEALLERVRASDRAELIRILENDPRPSYKEDGEREYGMKYAGLDVFFKVEDGEVTVTRVEKSFREVF
jgi:tRNA-Thr(GGU) m(6)t(6)A37 methyltransferase TsaA